MDAILSKGSPHDLYVDGPHLMELFQTHYPSFTIGVASTRHRPLRDSLVLWISNFFRTRLIDRTDGITIFLNFENETLLQAYRNLHPKRNIIIRFCDTIAPNKLPQLKALLEKLSAKGIINQAETYFDQNAQSLGIRYRPNSVNFEALSRYRFLHCRFLYAFIGVSPSNQSRLREFDAVKRKIYDLYPYIQPYIKEFAPRRVFHFIPYHDYLSIIGSSAIVVDMYRRFPTEGFSFRTAEALVLNKKIITNRTNILGLWFYHPNRFFIIGYDSLNRLQSFLESESPALTEAQLEHFTTDHITY